MLGVEQPKPHLSSQKHKEPIEIIYNPHITGKEGSKRVKETHQQYANIINPLTKIPIQHCPLTS
jgi:hypothetical protein